jgi:hypothetical protein
MDPVFPQACPIAPAFPAPPVPVTMAPASALPAARQQDRISRLTALGPQDAAAGLLWLAMNFPAVTDAMLDKVGYDAIDDPDPGREPEPFCAGCGADLGIFLRFGLDWHHYRGDGTITSRIEVFDPGHDPVIAWRLTRALATR